MLVVVAGGPASSSAQSIFPVSQWRSCPFTIKATVHVNIHSSPISHALDRYNSNSVRLAVN